MREIAWDLHNKKADQGSAELEAPIKVKMEDICEWPTDMAISVQPDGDSWKVKVFKDQKTTRIVVK